MKIAAINTVASADNAPGRIMLQISDATMRHGHEAMIAFGRGTTPVNTPCVRIGNNQGVLFHAAMSRLTDSVGLHSVSATKQFIKRLNLFSPDIIHLHNLHGYYINLPLLMQWLKESKIPVVWTFHDCWPFTGHCTHYTFNNCDKWRTNCYDCQFQRQYPKSFLLSNSRRNHSLKKQLFLTLPNLTIVTPSQWLADEVVQSFLGDYAIKVIPNGVDTDVFHPYKRNENKRTTILGVAAKWEPSKNSDFFIRLAHNMPDADILIVGEWPLHRQTQCPENIILLGHIADNNRLAEIYSSADIYINPSHEESFGMTTVEAMACGTPVIANNATAIPEPIGSQTGIILDINDEQAVTHAISHIITHRESYSSSCRQHAIEKYSVSKMTDLYINLYKQLL